MDDQCSEMILKKICCTCLSKDRLLFQLCRLSNGVNNLYLLLSYDSEAYREVFFKGAASLYICWECRAIMCRISSFRQQAIEAQRRLTSIADGRTDIKQQITLSNLSKHHKVTYDTIIVEDENYTDNFIDCGSEVDIKSEIDEDIPLSELNSNFEQQEKQENQTKINDRKKKKLNNETYYSIILINEEELKEIRRSHRMEANFVASEYKCNNCLEIFKSQEELERHDSNLHIYKINHIQCNICLIYIKDSIYKDHRENHYQMYNCLCCEYVTYNVSDIRTHLLDSHYIHYNLPVKKKKIRKEQPLKANDSRNKRTTFEYVCKECNKCFENKNQRWKHMQRYHKEGYKCTTCQKRFAFRSNLAKHELLHQGPPARTECPICHKQVRVDLLKIHSRIHTEREQFSCAECCKRFVSRASYEHHLKYTQAHAAINILKHKCSQCDKGYRSRGELRDHVNYQHMGKTQHKCPVCEKALATRRCVTRHVRRAHDGVKESARNKMCQQCGKVFRDKKCLREHELIHTGERPLSCEICGCTFRQSASLYTHKKRVHKIYPPTKTIELL